MPNPDRDDPDQEPRDRRTTPPPAEPSTGSSEARSRARVNPPAKPITPATSAPPRGAAGNGAQAAPPAAPAFVQKGGAPRPEAGDGRNGPKIDPELGLGWLGSGEGDAVAADQSPPAGSPRLVRPPRKSGPKIQPDLVGFQQIQGKHPGDRYVRVVRQQSDDFSRAGPGHLVATEEALAARGSFGRTFARFKRAVIGAPLTTAAVVHERLTKLKALAVLSSDALSSVAYATEAILAILILAGTGALKNSLPISVAIVALILIVGVSYRQTIKAYPLGGGSYIVAKDNIGELPALTAGAALLIDYVLTVAVSIAAGVAALVSAVPELHAHRVLLGLGFVTLVTVVNLRGIRESGSIFAIPTYLFLVGILAMIAIGIIRNAVDGFTVHQIAAGEVAPVEGVGIFLVLRAFASGCSAMTGVEAISDGVPAFKPPEWKNARSTLTWMIGILSVTFLGISFLAHQYGAAAMDAAAPGYQTVISQIAHSVLGGTNAAYYYIQFTTLAILVLAANTAFSDFPRLGYFLARDKYLPRQFTFRGDRLAFTTGIVTLGILSAILLAVFGGETDRLIPLYAVGVFTSFTISQISMMVRWYRLRERGWQRGLAINTVGAVATALVDAVVIVTKVTHGAWIVLVLIPTLILCFKAINRHYSRAAQELAAQTPLDPDEIKHTVIVPIAAINRIARQTLAYARSISDNVMAVHITDDEHEIQTMREAWTKLGTDIPLVIIESPYRALVGPLLKYIDEIDRQRPDDTITVVLPEFIARHWWEQLLHNQTALRIKAALLFRPGTVVTSVPYHLERPRSAAKA